MAVLHLQVSEELLERLARRAEHEFRSVEGQAQWILQQALRPGPAAVRREVPLYQRVRHAGRLYDELQRLHRRNGGMSSRTIARMVSEERGMNLSHATVNELLAGRLLVSWPKLEAIVQALEGDVEQFRELWVEARW